MNVDKLLKRKQHAKRDGNLCQLAEITKTLGDMYFENEQTQEALQEYIEQLSICEELGDKLSCAIAHRMIGEAYSRFGDYKQALIHQNLHLDGAKDAKNLIEEQRALATLGRIYFCLAESLSNQPLKQSEALSSAKTAYVNSMELCDKLPETEIKLEERMLMRARLLLNLGLTLEAQKEMQQAIDLIEQAASLCISNNFQEDLNRTYISLAAIYERQNNYELALNYIEIAITVNNTSLKANAKISKAELFMRTGQWIETRKILVSLYTSSGLPENINYQVEKYLRIIVTLCRTENSLLVETDVQNKQKLYEILGDAAVAVQCYEKGAEYYRHMLNCAEETGNEIGAALVSLARTLKDAGSYNEALPFAQKELQLCIDAREKIRSALFLIDLLITTDAADIEIREYYTLALNSANESGSVKLKKLVMREFVNYLENIGQFDEVKSIQQETELALQTLIDTESEASSEENCEIGADICLEDLSDLEIEENVKRININRRRTKKTSFLKRNEKGETRLHVACINGDIKAVEVLLSTHHPTNIRDYCGWTPLHEAANHGYVEIVELLLKHDANINDPGGTSCKGVTPLHDAACCGHFSVMQLLIDYGADITLKTKDGDTILDYLIEWKNRVENLSMEDLIEYEIMYKKLSAIVSTKSNKKKSGSVQTSEKKLTQPELKELSAGEDYKRTIANLRSFNKSNSAGTSKICNNTPLINEEQILFDDWLEDDTGNIVKKKSVSNDYVITSKRKSIDRNIESTTKRLKLNSAFQNIDEFSANEDSCDSITSNDSELFSKSKTIKRKRQATLMSSGFIHTPSPVVDMETLPHTSSSKQRKNECINLCIFIKEKMFDLKIEFCEDKKEFMKHIITKSEQKFYNETGCTAKLFIQSINGNHVTEENILKIISENKCISNKLECEIVELKIPSIVERYRIICCTHNTTPCEIMIKSLKSCENTSAFRIKSDDSNKESLVPLIKTLEYQKDIKILQLSGTVLSIAGVHVHYCLLNLSSLQELYLKGCDIDFAYLCKINVLPPQLRILDLSYNPLSSESCEILKRLIAPLKYLQTLNLCYCELEDFCLSLENSNLISCDVSWNKLNRDSMISFLGRQLFDLNLSNTLSYKQSNINLYRMGTVLSPSFESLDLSSCDIKDSDVKIISEQLPRLCRLILNGNTNVSVSSIKILLSRQPTLSYINVSGCKMISSSPEEGLVIHNPEICTLFVSIEPNLCDLWIKLWRGTGIVTELPHNLAVFKPI